MVPGELRTVRPCLRARPERGRTCASVWSGQLEGQAGGHQLAGQRGQGQGGVEVGQQVHAGGGFGLVAGQRQVAVVAHATHLHGDDVHGEGL